MVNYFRNACIALTVGAITSPAVFASDLSDAATTALASTEADVTGTAPKVLAVVAIVVGVGVLVGLVRKA